MIKGQPHILNYLMFVSGYVIMFNVFIENKNYANKKSVGLEKGEHVETQFITTKRPLLSFLAAGEYLGPN